MKNETIKTFTEINVEQALNLAERGERLCFSSNTGTNKQWTAPMELESININRFTRFRPARWHHSFQHCATVTELDPCLSPDGCPELEPWMAYVGLGPMENAGGHHKFIGFCQGEWQDGKYGLQEWHYAIDVRTSWAKEHFPEHVRIRNYQEPYPFNDLIQEICFERHNTDGRSFTMDEMQESYELGQANPKPTK